MVGDVGLDPLAAATHRRPRVRRGSPGRVEAYEHGRLVAALALSDVVGDERLELRLRGESALDEEAAPRAGQPAGVLETKHPEPGRRHRPAAPRSREPPLCLRGQRRLARLPQPAVQGVLDPARQAVDQVRHPLDRRQCRHSDHESRYGIEEPDVSSPSEQQTV